MSMRLAIHAPSHSAPHISAPDVLRPADPDADLEAQARFAATVSHEIRTPLHGILGMAALLAETQLTPSQSDYVRAIRNSGEHLLDLLNSVLDFTRLDAGELLLEDVAFSPGKIIQDVAELLAPRAHAKSLDLAASCTADVPYVLLGDAGRIRQILFNLVGNAIKFTDVGSVLLRAEMCGDKVRFGVRDTGPGLTAEQAERCFNAFSQSRASDAGRDSGVGLGLAIVAALARAMGGKAGVQSERMAVPNRVDAPDTGIAGGPGAWFFVDLPLRSAANGTEAERPRDTQGPAPRIVLQDVWPATAWTIAEALGARGISCFAASGTVPVSGSASAPTVVLVGAEAGMAALAGTVPGDRCVVVLRPEDRSVMPELLSKGASGFLIRPIRVASLLARLLGDVTEDDGGAEALEGETVDPGQGKPATAPEQISRGRKALVADDNPVNGLLARKALEAVGWTVEVVSNGAEAVDLARQQHFDLIVMDLRMPVMDGLAASRMIRTGGERNHDTPIIAASAQLDPDTERNCKQVGIDHCALKPLDPMRLRDLVARLVTERTDAGPLDD